MVWSQQSWGWMFKFYCKGFCSETALKKKKVISFIRHDPAHAEMFTIVSGLKVKQMALRCCSVLICWKSVLSSKCSVVHTQQSQLVFTLGLRPLEVHILLKATTLSLALKPCVKIGVWQHDSGFLFFFCRWCMVFPFSGVMEPRIYKHTN